jgi:iron-sulfur cluster assembly accessory protein
MGFDKGQHAPIFYGDRPAFGNPGAGDLFYQGRDMSETIDTNVVVTERAAKHIAELLGAESTAQALRVAVESGGCSGLQYKFDLVPAAEPDDTVLESGNAKVVIDQMSLSFLAGSQIDYVSDLMGAAFRITNPQATASCGCGTSFAT